MSTMQTSEQTPDWPITPLRPTLAHPLGRVRRTIRVYVTIEFLILCVISAGIWFLSTLLVDWGFFFQLLGLDYVRDGSTTIHGIFRGVLLLIPLLGLIYLLGWKFVQRVAREMNNSAVALLLERRFPDNLGDRFVTAVELADSGAVRRYGYSSPLVEATVQDAVDRVRGLPLGQLFDWGRLLRLAGSGVVLVAAVVAIVWTNTGLAATWVERDLLLRGVHWPRQTMVELRGFPESGQKSIPFGGEVDLEIVARKWVVPTRDNADRWRPMMWPDAAKVVEDNPSLNTTSFVSSNLELLPETWRTWSLDDVELPVKDVHSALEDKGTSLITPVRLATMNRVGRAALRWVRSQSAGSSDRARFIPEDWQQLSEEALQEHLRMSAEVRPSDVRRMVETIQRANAAPNDEIQWFASIMAPIKPVIIPSLVLRELVPSAFALTEEQLKALPVSRRALPSEELLEFLNDWMQTKTPVQLAAPIIRELNRLYQELETLAARRHYGRQAPLRRLEVPESVTVEFTQVLSSAERARVRPKLGRPTVRRKPDSNEYRYAFRKVERSLQFRIIANDTTIHWKDIRVVPLPKLNSLTRIQHEPGYLYESNQPVVNGPLTVSLEGTESRFEAPYRSVVSLLATADKPLRSVQALPVDQEEGRHRRVESVAHADGESTFDITLERLDSQDVVMRLKFVDEEGVAGERLVTIVPDLDQEPGFLHAHFEVVRREMITPRAVIPFSGRIRDDHGLRSIEYDLVLSTMEGNKLWEGRVPLRTFRSLRMAQPPVDARTQWSPARITATSIGLRAQAALAFPSAAIVHPAGRLSVSGFEFVDDHSFDFPLRDPDQPVLKPEVDEFLDTEFLPRIWEQKFRDIPFPVSPYRLSIRIAARDNALFDTASGEGQQSYSPETFEFLVVDETDLLVETGNRETELRDRFAAILKDLRKSRTVLRRIRDDLPMFGGDDFRRGADDCRDTAQAILGSRDSVDGDIARGFRQIYRELVLNRSRTDVLVRIDQKICRPLESIVRPDGQFTQVQEIIGELAARLAEEKESMGFAPVQRAIDEMDQLLSRLDAIMNEMQKLMEFNQALAVLRELIKGQENINKDIERLIKEREELEFDDL